MTKIQHSLVFIKQEVTQGLTATIHLDHILKQETNKNVWKKSFYVFKNTLANYYLVKEEIKSAIVKKNNT